MWIAPAIESGIRGAIQLRLELGLVDEVDDSVDKWMARCIDIVSFIFFLVMLRVGYLPLFSKLILSLIRPFQMLPWVF